MTFSIIIPTRNERNNLKKLLPVLVRLYPESPIWIVDDNSVDGTEKFIRQFFVSHPQVHLITRQTKHGRGSAVIDGLRQAFKNKTISYFLEMDADGSHNPQEIKKLLSESLKTPRGWQAEVETKALTPPMVKESVIIGSRHIKGAEFINCFLLRIFLSKLANFYARFILGVPISDYTNGFRLYPKDAVQLLINSNINEKGYITLSETAYILYKKGFNFIEVPTIFVNRKEGKSNATIAEFLRSIPAIISIKQNH